MAKGTCCPMCRKEYAIRPPQYIPAQRHNLGPPPLANVGEPPRPRPRPQYQQPGPQTLHRRASEISIASGLTQAQFNTIVSIVTTNN